MTRQKKVKMIAGSMAIQMQNLIVEGANTAPTLSIDTEKESATKTYGVMQKSVMTYQSAFSSKTTAFAKSSMGNMKVSVPSQSHISGSSKQRHKRKSKTKNCSTEKCKNAFGKCIKCFIDTGRQHRLGSVYR